jgi:pimeloyl-ACP methyl ester carboxylesterase
VNRRLAALALAALTAACAPEPPPSSPASSPLTTTAPSAVVGATPATGAFATSECPDDIAVVFVVTPTCGYLTVPERWEAPDAASIRVFVARVDPADGVEAEDPMVVVGESLGGRIDYGGLAVLAHRTGRVVYIVDRRGTGLSEPALRCPEVVAARSTMLAFPARDPQTAALLTAALGECRARLIGDGIDIEAYGLVASARDIEALRTTLDLPPWNVISFGSASRLALEVARQAPVGVRSIVLDSPVPAQGPDPAFNPAAAVAAMARLAELCRLDATCGEAHGDVAAELGALMERLREEPITLLAGATGPSPTIVLDDIRASRSIRATLGFEGGRQIPSLLRSMRALSDATIVPDDPLVRLLTEAGDACVGYFPDCANVEDGSWLGTLCAEVLPFLDRPAVLSLAAGTPWLAPTFEHNPLFAACDAWAVEPADPAIGAPVVSDVPALVIVGQFDPYAGPLRDLEAALDGLSNATFLEVSNQSYNVFGFNECPRQVRRGWLDDPIAPLATACLADLPPIRLAP